MRDEDSTAIGEWQGASQGVSNGVRWLEGGNEKVGHRTWVVCRHYRRNY